MDGCRVEEVVRKWNKVMNDWALAIVEHIAPTFEGIKKLCEVFSDHLWTAYTAAGMPYGETPEGMWKWAHECAKIERLKREAEAIEIHHKQMVAFRQMLAERSR